jgi:hypothetical protein
MAEDRRPLNEAERFEREQFWIARPNADGPEMAGLGCRHHGSC